MASNCVPIAGSVPWPVETLRRVSASQFVHEAARYCDSGSRNFLFSCERPAPAARLVARYISISALQLIRRASDTDSASIHDMVKSQ